MQLQTGSGIIVHPPENVAAHFANQAAGLAGQSDKCRSMCEGKILSSGREVLCDGKCFFIKVIHLVAAGFMESTHDPCLS